MARNFTVKLPQSPTSGYPGVNYVQTLPCLLSDNDFIPVKCLMDGERLTKGSKVNFLYQLNIPISNYSVIGRFARFVANLEVGNNWLRIRTANLGTNIYMGSSGIIIHVDESYNIIPLMLMCVRSSQLFTLNREGDQLDKFTLLIDNRFLSDSEYRKLFRNIKVYLNRVTEAGINTLYTNSIERMCLCHRPVEKPKFANITEMLKYSDTLNKQILV